MAMPVRAPVSASVTLELRLTKDETRVPTAPDGAPAFAFSVLNDTAIAVLSTGASLSPVTVTLAVCDAVTPWLSVTV